MAAAAAPSTVIASQDLSSAVAAATHSIPMSTVAVFSSVPAKQTDNVPISLSLGEILGGIVGGLIFVSILFTFMFKLLHRRSQNSESQESSSPPAEYVTAPFVFLSTSSQKACRAGGSRLNGNGDIQRVQTRNEASIPAPIPSLGVAGSGNEELDVTLHAVSTAALIRALHARLEGGEPEELPPAYQESQVGGQRD
ncbi:hypothetical protein L218DRAFT_1029219 [Marasmius fiardii PR-910]|nr:hypothetical protein L218DRAFT_1029219 [Marasmius fiardii PR-910]